MFLDEVTKEPNWHRSLKGWFDFHYPLRFLVSSSSSSELGAGSAESLTGRVTTHLLMTWKFVDVLSLRTGDTATNTDYLEARSVIPSAVRKGDPSMLHSSLVRLRPRSSRRRSLSTRPSIGTFSSTGTPSWPARAISVAARSDSTNT